MVGRWNIFHSHQHRRTNYYLCKVITIVNKIKYVKYVRIFKNRRGGIYVLVFARSDNMKTFDFLPEFMEAIENKLKNDDLRWGDTWLHRTRKGQEERTIKSFNDKFDKYINGGQPIDWLGIIGDAFIAWVRENHPEIWTE
jgi:hypothetical protein